MLVSLVSGSEVLELRGSSIHKPVRLIAFGVMIIIIVVAAGRSTTRPTAATVRLRLLVYRQA